MKKTTKQRVDALEKFLRKVDSTNAELRHDIDALAEELQAQRAFIKEERSANVDMAQKVDALVKSLHKLA